MLVAVSRMTAMDFAPTPANRPTPSGVGPVRTSVDGHFTFRNVRPGSYHLDATADGYLRGAAGQVRPDGPIFMLAIAAGHDEAAVTITRCGSRP